MNWRTDLSETIVCHLAADPSDLVQASLIENQTIEVSFLVMLAESTNLRVLELVVRHSKTPVAILERLVKMPELHSHFACNKKTPSHILETIAATGNYNLEDFAKHHKTPHLILQLIADTRQYDAILAKHFYIPPDIVKPILCRLSISTEEADRRIAVRHSETPRAILEQLAYDVSPEIQRFANNRLNFQP